MTAVALLVLGLLGCGGGDESSDSLTKAAFVKQGNALCKKERAEREEVAAAAISRYLAEKTPEAKKEVVLTVLRHYEEMTTHLADLGAPEGDEDEVAGIIQTMEKSAAKAKANYASAFEANFVFRPANKAVEDYGLAECTA
jgi:hypothetical protein